MIVRVRDSQRAKVYRAEAILKHHRGHSRWAADLKAGDLISARVYVGKLATDARILRWWPAAASIAPILDLARSKSRHTSYTRAGHVMRLTRQHLGCEWALLHEFAHMIVWWQHQEHDKAAGRNWFDLKCCASHGREFAAIYLRLVRYRLGKEAEESLRAAFVAERVRYRKRRDLAPDAKQGLLARLQRRADRTTKAAVAATTKERHA